MGRPYAEIECTEMGGTNGAPGAMTADDVIGPCRSVADLVVRHTIRNMPNAHEIAPLEVFGKMIIPTAADL